MPDGETLARAYAREYYGSSAKKFIGPIARLVGRLQEGRSRLVERYAPPLSGCKLLLDVGCGNGDFLRQAARRGYAPEGTELSPESARRASPDGSLKVHIGEVASLAFQGGTYRAVTLWHVLEHLREPLAALRTARAALQPDGKLFLSLPNVGSVQAKRYGKHWFHRDPPRHLWHFGVGTLAALLQEAGFRPLRWWHFSLEQNPYGFLQSTLNASGHQQDHLYEILKGAGGAARMLDRDVLQGVLLAPLCLALSAYEAAIRRGGTVTVVAAPVAEREPRST